MDQKSLEMLEFPKAREILAGFTSFSASRELALKILPSSDEAVVSRLLGQSAEARRLLSKEPDFSIGGAGDVREAAQLADRGKVLEPQVLLDIRATLACARVARARVAKLARDLPLLWGVAGQIVPLPDLEEKIGKSISPAAEVLDSASERLSELRFRLREAQQQLLNRLESILKSPRGRRCAQEAYVTQREGRYVIPLKAEFHKEIKGIVHDISNTGATVFVEPWSTIEVGNELRQLTIEEEREVERILMALSAEVGASEAVIGCNVSSMAELDMALAKARYAERVRGTEAMLWQGEGSQHRDNGAGAGVIRLVNARHPLLSGKAVPLSVEMGSDYSGLVITGPNTGGKTVALKTIGLLALMTQAGMPIPASPETCIPVFDGVFADIGDEQSIEQTLSTFSSHMGNIVRIIRSSSGRALVLLDELGTSTDPGEGSALARAILLHLISKGAMVAATTHYGDLKVFAHSTPGLRNASLDFDPATLAPTYHLTMGIPGGSNALAIASQLGLPSEIVAAARGMLVKGTQDMEKLLADLMAEKQRIESVRADLEAERSASVDLKRHWEGEVEKLEREERRLVAETRDRLADETAELQKEIRRAASELKKVKSQETIEQAEKALAAVRAELKALTTRLREKEGSAIGEPAAATQVGVGDRVWLPETSTWGTVLALRPDEGQIEVQVGSTRVVMGLGSAEKLQAPPGKVLPEPTPARPRLSARAVSLELDLRGRRAEEVAPELDRYLNDASLAGLGQVRVIHGYGTGTVRQIVRDALASHPLVKSFRPGGRGEGGDGVTVVVL